jgi:hypothetical protein
MSLDENRSASSWKKVSVLIAGPCGIGYAVVHQGYCVLFISQSQLLGATEITSNLGFREWRDAFPINCWVGPCSTGYGMALIR